MSDLPVVIPYAQRLGNGVYMSASSVMHRLLHVGRRRADRTLGDVWAGNIQSVLDSDPYALSGNLSDSLRIDMECDDITRQFTNDLVQLGLH